MPALVRLGNWVWDPDTQELRSGSRTTTLEPRVAQLFDYFLQHQGELLSRDRLVDAVWDGRVVSDEAVRRAVFTLRQALTADGADAGIRTVYKKGYIVNFPAPVTGETAPESDDPGGAAVATETPPTDAIQVSGAPTAYSSSASRRWVPAGAAAVALLFAAVLAYLGLRPASDVSTPGLATLNPTPATIAVLPFRNSASDQAGQLLADGLTEELLNALERNQQLRVTARGSAFQFGDEREGAREIGQHLGVRYLLEGSVEGSDNNLKVRTRLVDTANAAELWTSDHQSAEVDWYALQQAIAAEISQAVQKELDLRAPVPRLPSHTTSEDAQQELLRARQLLITRSVADAEQAIEHLQRALTLDPNYALAYARLADAIMIQAASTTGIKAARGVVAPLLDKALALDPGLGEAWCLRSQLTDDNAEAMRDLRRGLELNPSYARGYELMSRLAPLTLRQNAEAVEAIDNAIALDPLTPGNYHAKAGLMMGHGDWHAAAALDRRALELNPNFRDALVNLSQLYAIEGFYTDAVAFGRRAVALDPRGVPMRNHMTNLYLALGDVEAAQAVSAPLPPNGHWQLLLAEGKEAQILDAIYSSEPVPVDKIDPLVGTEVLLRQAVKDGNYARALAVVAPVLPTGFTLPANTVGWGLYPYANITQLLRLSGDEAAAARLEQELEERMTGIEKAFPRHRVLNNQVRAILHARAGRSEEACSALEDTYTPNPRPFWWIVLGNPAFDNMRSAPCFVTLRTRLETYIAAERTRIAGLDDAGYAPDGNTPIREDEPARPIGPD